MSATEPDETSLGRDIWLAVWATVSIVAVVFAVIGFYQDDALLIAKSTFYIAVAASTSIPRKRRKRGR